MSADFTPALGAGLATEKLGRVDRGFVNFHNRRPYRHPGTQRPAARIEREATIVCSRDSLYPAIKQGKAHTYFFDREGVRMMDAIGLPVEVPLLAMDGTTPAAVRPSGMSWQIADLYDNIYATNGETMFFYWKGLWRAVPWTTDGTTPIAPKINTLGVHKEGRVFFGGILHPFSIVDWPTILKAAIAPGDDDEDTLQNMVASTAYGRSWVFWTSLGGGDAMFMFDEEFMQTADGSHYTEENPYWRALWRENTAGARPMPWQGDVHRIIELGESEMVYGENGIVALRPSHAVGMQPIRGFSETVGIAGRDAVDGDMSGQVMVDQFGSVWAINPGLSAENLGGNDLIKPMVEQEGGVRVHFEHGEREFHFVSADRTYILNRHGFRSSWVRSVSMAVLHDNARVIVHHRPNMEEAGVGARYYVDIDATGAVDGSSWEDAFTSIQDGIDACSPGDEVWVRQGSYNERIALAEGVTLFGGFTGVELDPAERTGIVYLDGSGGSAPYATVEVVGAEDCVIDGFVITGGDNDNGGGVYCNSANLRLSRCAFVGNNASNDGGGVYMDEDGVIENCLFDSNTCDNDGAGLRVTTGSAVSVYHCTFRQNVAGSDGSCIRGPATVANSILVYGGGNTNALGTTAITYSCVYPAGATGTGNFPNDPLFTPDGGGALQWNSPCRDAGLALYNPETDILRRSRGDVVDVGCFSFPDELTAKIETNWFSDPRIAGLPELRAIQLAGEHVSSWRGWLQFQRRDQDEGNVGPVALSFDGLGECWPRTTGHLYKIILETDDETADLDVFNTLITDEGERNLESWLPA